MQSCSAHVHINALPNNFVGFKVSSSNRGLPLHSWRQYLRAHFAMKVFVAALHQHLKDLYVFKMRSLTWKNLSLIKMTYKIMLHTSRYNSCNWCLHRIQRPIHNYNMLNCVVRSPSRICKVDKNSFLCFDWISLIINGLYRFNTKIIVFIFVNPKQRLRETYYQK